MNLLTDSIRFELDSRLKETAEIIKDEKGKYGFTTSKGYNSWEGDLYDSFDRCYTALKKYEMESIKELKYL